MMLSSSFLLGVFVGVMRSSRALTGAVSQSNAAPYSLPLQAVHRTVREKKARKIYRWRE
jgi:hypothetical protein